MEVHRYERLWTGASLLLIVGFVATVTYGAVGAGVSMIGDADTVDPDALGETEGFDDPGVTKVGEDEYAVHVVASQFLFTPGSSQPIEVPADSTVTFYVTSADVQHGFSLVGTNVNAMVIPGQVTKMTVEFEEPETYGIVCNEYCGAAHHTMAGNVEVVPRSEWEDN